MRKKIFNLKVAKLVGEAAQSSGNGPSLFCYKRFTCVKMLLPKSTSYFLFGVGNVNKGDNSKFGGSNRFKRR